MSKLKKLITHLRKGTIKDRVRYQFSGLKKWEDMKAGKRKYVIHKISSRIKIKLYPDSYLSYLILKGEFELNEIAFTKRFLKAGDIFWDIGANIGLFSLFAADKNCEVTAFEPTPVTFSRLSENMQINRFSEVKLFNVALSDVNGESFLNVSQIGMDAWNTISDKQEEGFIKIPVQTKTLDLFSEENKPNKNKTLFIKMDVEGWERNVIKGGEKFLKEHAPVLMIEFNDENFRANNYLGKDLIQYLKELGYSFYEIGRTGVKPHHTAEVYEYMNLIAVKDDMILKSRGVYEA